MKIFYSIIIWGILQLFAVKPLEASNSSAAQPTSVKEQLFQYYEDEFQLFDKEFVEKAKKFSEKLLKDKMLQTATKPLLSEFKQNITDFLNNYRTYKRYDLNSPLLRQFLITTTNHYPRKATSNKDSQDISEVLKRQGYEELYKEYEHKFEELIRTKLLPKFEKLKAQLMASNSKKNPALSQWHNDMKSCPDYDCYVEELDNLYQMLNTPKDDLLDYIIGNLDNLYIYYTKQAYDLAKSMLRDRKIQQLLPPIRRQFDSNVKNFLMKYEREHDIDQIYKIILDFHYNISMKFYYNTKLSHRQLLVDIFDRNGFAEFDFNFKLKFNNFINPGLFKQFEAYRRSLSPEELVREQGLFKWLDHFKGLNIYAARVVEFAKLPTLLNRT